jgi:hypothetical protein
VSVPVAAGAMRAATAAAEPPEEPPGTQETSQGFFTGPKNEVSLDEPMANSSMLSLPSVTMPAAESFSTTWRRRAKRSWPASSSRSSCASRWCRKYPCAPAGCPSAGRPRRQPARRRLPAPGSGSCRGPGDEGVQAGVEPSRCGRGNCVASSTAGDLFRCQRSGELTQRRVDVRSLIRRPSDKVKPGLGFRATAWKSARRSVSVTTSGRRRCTTSTAWAIGSMPVVSTACSCSMKPRMPFSWSRVASRSSAESSMRPAGRCGRRLPG